MSRFWPIKLAAVPVLVMGLFLAVNTWALDTQNFSFDSFSADYYLSRDEQKTPLLKVDEVLVARFPDFDQNHGILRVIPQRYQDHTLSLKILAVTDENNQPYTYSTSRQNNNRVLKIGDGDRYVHGLKTYKISYEMRNVINYQPDQEEFYWDINGDQWYQPFDSVIARLHLPKEMPLNPGPVCYAGVQGSKYTQGCRAGVSTKDDGGTLITGETYEISPGQTLTMVAGFPKGTFIPGPEIAREEMIRKLKIVLAIAAGAIPPIVAGGLMYGRWRRFGDDPKDRGIIIPEYEPPKALDVLGADFILQQKLRNEAVSALLIDMAVGRQLTIYEIPKKGLFGSKDYELELNKTIQTFSGDSLKILKLVFDDKHSAGSRIKLSDYKKDSTKRQEFYNQLKEVEDGLSDRLFKQGYFKKDPKKVKSSYQLWALLPFFTGMALIWAGVMIVFSPLVALGGGLISAALVMWIFASIMPARTLAGVQAHDNLLGLKDYIKMAEADRLRYLQSPAGAEKIAKADAFSPKTAAAKVKLFEKLLPYAMLFGQEKDWAKQFKDLYTQPPDWYRGNWTAFNAGYLASSLGSFSTSAGQVFAAPSSSSGSGFSGGAGGGGGGGGGGGW